MDIVLLTKRGVAFQRVKRGEQLVILIPTPDTVKVYKDITDTSTIADRYGTNGQKPLWREFEGQTIVYGVLSETLAQRRQALRVHLPQDFCPADSNAFYFVMDDRWMLHGRKETDDEGRQDWRTTLIKIPEDQSATVILRSAVGELLLEGAESRITVAVYDNLALYEETKKVLQPFDILPVPFSALKVGSKLKPLYRQRDYTAVMLLLVAGALVTLLAAASYWYVYWQQSAKLSQQMDGVRARIAEIQISKSLGDVREPELLLADMQKAFQNKPSSILSAGAGFGKEFGELESVSFNAGNVGVQGGDAMRAINKGQYVLRVNTNKVVNKLLVDQEKLAKILLTKTPWIRRVENFPQGEGTLVLDLVIQAEAEEGVTP